MATNTIYSDSYMVVVDHNQGVNTAPWLNEVTYLIDASGQTTAVLAQTNQPTSGVSLEPVPYTPIEAAVANPTLPSTSTSADTPSNPRPSPLSTTLTIAIGILGTFLILALVGTLWYFLRRQSMKSRLQSSDSRSKLDDRSKLSTSSEILPVLADQTPPAVEDKINPLSSSNLRSILKHPSKPSKTKSWLGAAKGVIGKVGEEDFKPTFDEEEPPTRRKGVTFGENQVREFGRTPLPSRTASLMSRSTRDYSTL